MRRTLHYIQDPLETTLRNQDSFCVWQITNLSKYRTHVSTSSMGILICQFVHAFPFKPAIA